jgi:hypothetical protein
MKAQLLPAMLFGSLLALATIGCEDEPLDEPIPIPAPTAASSVQVEPEDAGAGGGGGAGGAGGNDAGVAKKKGPWDPLRISRCCAALAANRDSAPLTQRGAYDLAVVTCNQARKNPVMIHRVAQLVPGIPACR